MNFEHYQYDYFDDRPVDVVREHQRRVYEDIHLRIRLRNMIDPFAMSLPAFRSKFRLPQHLALELCQRLTPYMPENFLNIRYIPLEIKVLCALAFFAKGSYQEAVGAMSCINISRSSVSNAVADVTNALNHDAIIARFIRFPADRREREFTIARNERLGLPRVLGYIDGTLIKITPPPHDMDGEVYFCRKNYCAINVQIVCDSDLYVMDINARFPGSANDPYVYRQSGVREVMQEAYQQSRCWLLGDSIYPLEPWLQTPIPNAEVGSPEYDFTQLHCQNRNPVERCNGVLKGRWRCCLWDRTLHYLPEKAGSIINACAVLHNFCILNNLALQRDEEPPPNPDDDDPDDPDVLDDDSNEEDEDFENGPVGPNARQLRQLALAERQYLIDEVQARRWMPRGARRRVRVARGRLRGARRDVN